MKVQHSAMTAVFLGLGFEPAAKWNLEKANAKLQALLEIIDDPKQVNAEMLEDDDQKQLFKEIKAAHKAEKAVVIVADVEDEEAPAKPAKAAAAEEEDETPAPKKKAAAVTVEDDDDAPPAKPAKKAAAATDDEDETPAPAKKKAAAVEEDDDTPAPAKKKAAAPAAEEDETPAPKKKKAAAVEEDETPAPAKKKAKKAAAGKVERDEFGSVEGSSNAKVNAALSAKKALTFNQIVEKSGLTRSTVRYAHLDGLVKAKHAVEVDLDGVRAWKLKS